MILLLLISIATVFILYIVNSPIVVIFFVIFSYFVIYRFLSKEGRFINEPSVRVEKEKQKKREKKNASVFKACSDQRRSMIEKAVCCCEAGLFGR